MLVKLDKISSVTARVGLQRFVEVSSTIAAERGAVLVVEALEEKAVYGELELEGGRLARIIKGDIIAGVLGERQALKGFVGAIPEQIVVGDILHILNMGGVIGLCRSANSDFGKPLQVRVLGAALFDGQPANIAHHAVSWRTNLSECAPIILMLTC